MSNDWSNKRVLVTGGSSGLGRILAESFASAGARVAICALESGAAENAAAEIATTTGAETLGMTANITQQSDVDRLVETIQSKWGSGKGDGLDILVNNAGRSMRGLVADTTPEQFRDLMELNFIALVRMTRACLPMLLASHGSVVNIGSLAAKSASRWVGAYPATKHAVAAYSQQLRLELAPQGLHVLLVCPGPIQRDTERLYPLDGMEQCPERARRPGAGVQVKRIPPKYLASRVLQACEKRIPEIVLPGKARLLFAISQLWPQLGDWIVLHKT
ncbi:MAG: SDR family NAD(P)-dependent oxidoreductase [Thermoguttaceae bacterium]|nr:SDR family NAD(P)-dependent oxidoreductase [Thermoguttaceae bacterium]